MFYHSDEINQVKSRQAVVDLARATTQIRIVSFGKERRFSAIDVRHKDGNWQVLDSDGKWYTRWMCEA